VLLPLRRPSLAAYRGGRAADRRHRPNV